MHKLLSVGTVFLFALAIGFFGSTLYVEQAQAAAAPPALCIEEPCYIFQHQNFKGTNGPCPVTTIWQWSGNKFGSCCGELLGYSCNVE